MGKPQNMAVAKQKSASVSHRRDQTRKDERIRRTRIQIDAAFVELLHRRHYGSIRVSDITKKAHIGRATFYAHYPDKDTLLRSQFDRIVAPMIGRAHGTSAIDATAFFDHIRTAPHFYKTLMGPEGGTAPGYYAIALRDERDSFCG
jgi:AcrR family transcriptional regulator